MITQNDIQKRLKAGNYYQLASDSYQIWDDTETYSTDDIIKILDEKTSYYVSYRSLTDNNLNNDPLTDVANWKEYSEITEQCITEAKLYVESFVINRSHTYDETNKFQNQAILLYACGLLIDSANQMTNSDGEETPGIDEKNRATEILDNAFKMRTDETPKQSPYAYVSNTNSKVRKLQEVDPNNYYNKNYTTNDYENN